MEAGIARHGYQRQRALLKAMVRLLCPPWYPSDHVHYERW